MLRLSEGNIDDSGHLRLPLRDFFRDVGRRSDGVGINRNSLPVSGSDFVFCEVELDVEAAELHAIGF